MTPMKQNNIIAHLRRLCCSELSKEIVVTEFLQLVPQLVASQNNTFTGTDSALYPRYHIASFDIGRMRESIPKLVESFHTPELQRRAQVWFSQHSALTDPNVLDPEFYRGDLYNLVYREYNMHHLLWMPVRRGGSALGVAGFYRPRDWSPFSDADRALLGHTLQYLAHALEADDSKETIYSDTGRSGMIIMNQRGEIVSLSREAEQLLRLAGSPRLLIDHRREDRLQAKLRNLCLNLNAIRRGLPAEPPSYCHTNGRGRFWFRAYFLKSQVDNADALIGLTVEHREPVSLLILRAIRGLPLSPMQQQVAQFVAQGVSFENIGNQLHIKPTTVKDHISKIYTKLDISQRDELLPKLLALANERLCREPRQYDANLNRMTGELLIGTC